MFYVVDGVPWTREEVVVTLVQLTGPWRGGASLPSSQQPLLQRLRDELIGKNALKDAGKVVMVIVCADILLGYSHVGHLPLGLVDVDGVVVDNAGQLLETAVKGRRVVLLVGAALKIFGHHVLLEAELGTPGQVQAVDVV